MQRTLTYFVKGNITVQLTSCLTGLDSAFLLNWNYKQICLFGQILTGQTGGHPYSDISPYKVSECSLIHVTLDPMVKWYLTLQGELSFSAFRHKQTNERAL